jgi:hypothetical protein
MRLRLEARSTLARYLRAGTDCLSPLAVRRIFQVADEDVMGSLTAVCRLDREVNEISTTHPSGDPIEQMESVVQMYEEEILEWERTRTVHPDSDADPDLVQEPTGQKLVQVLEKNLAEDEAAEYPPLRLADTAWTRQVLWQATNSVLFGRGDLRHLDHGREATLRIQHLPVEDGAGGQTPLRLLRRSG